MIIKKPILLCSIILGTLISCVSVDHLESENSPTNEAFRSVWSKQKSWEWYNQQDWIVGANFTPSTAINQLEFWQKDTYDSVTIDREIGYAEELGFNTLRVYLHYLVWVRNPDAFKERIDNFLSISSKHDIKIMFVLFDDCWNDHPQLGKQPAPKFGVHNSGWAQCPGGSLVDDKALFPVLKAYTQDILNRFGHDKRVLIWDLYNEPGNFDILERSLPLLKNVVKWARMTDIDQPITIGLWSWLDEFKNFNQFQIENSDIISFHHYDSANHLNTKVAEFEAAGRPLICTEYMARTRGNTFESHLPILKERGIGAFNWGLVNGKTNTIYMWDSVYLDEPDLWFHDILNKDGSSFDDSEVALIKSLTKK